MKIIEYRMDLKAKAGMLYLRGPSDIPIGELPFSIIEAKFVYGVFHHNSEAMMIEVGVDALDGEVIDFYDQSM